MYTDSGGEKHRLDAGTIEQGIHASALVDTQGLVTFIGPTQALGLVREGLLAPGCAINLGLPGLLPRLYRPGISQLCRRIHFADFFKQAMQASGLIRVECKLLGMDGIHTVTYIVRHYNDSGDCSVNAYCWPPRPVSDPDRALFSLAVPMRRI